MTSSGDELKQKKRGLLISEDSKIIEGVGKTWIQVGSSRTYIPSQDDIDSRLKLVSVAIDDMGIKMSPINVFFTTPVIRLPRPYPRHMVLFCSFRKFGNPKFTAKPFEDESFRVLSYNILADLYAMRDSYSHCPRWALTWEYRRRNLLNEMLSYDADILCLQEVILASFRVHIGFGIRNISACCLTFSSLLLNGYLHFLCCESSRCRATILRIFLNLSLQSLVIQLFIRGKPRRYTSTYL